MGDLIFIDKFRKEKPKQVEMAPTTDQRLESIRASILRIDQLMGELKSEKGK
jgi:hypothetical protein